MDERPRRRRVDIGILAAAAVGVTSALLASGAEPDPAALLPTAAMLAWLDLVAKFAIVASVVGIIGKLVATWLTRGNRISEIARGLDELRQDHDRHVKAADERIRDLRAVEKLAAQLSAQLEALSARELEHATAAREDREHMLTAIDGLHGKLDTAADRMRALVYEAVNDAFRRREHGA